MFAVKRVCLRGHRYDIDAFMRKTKTTAKDVQSNIIKLQILEVFDCRGKKNKKGNYPGLYLDDVISGVKINSLCVFVLNRRVIPRRSTEPERPRHRREMT